MFEPGTKVIVIASSTTKGVGARHGSIGYITDCGHSEYHGKILVGEATVTVTPITVLFTRYGFGKEREKFEKKNILAVFPIFSEFADDKSFNEKVNKFVKKFKKEKFDESGWYYTKSVFTDRPESMDTCIIAPYPVRNHNLSTCSDTEFETWFNSIVLSRQVQLTLNKVYHPNFSIKFPEKVRTHFTHLRNSARNKDAREDFLRTLNKSSKIKESVIAAIRVVQCAGITKSRIKERGAIMRSYQNGYYHTGKQGKIKPGSFYQMFISKVFNDSAFDRLINMMKNYSIKDKFFIIKSVEDTKNVLQNMASVLSCK